MIVTEEQVLKGKSLSELERFFEALGQPRFRASQAFRRINRLLAQSLDEFTEFPKALRATLADQGALPELPVVKSVLSEDGTERFVFDAGHLGRSEAVREIEAVWLVSPRRRTVCISSQVGCTLNCRFCATGTMVYRGNLETWQIVDQVYELIRRKGEAVTNVVFMGMGEPFHNYENVIRAAHILHHPEGLNLGARHITISTAGVIPSIERFIKDREPFNLAISLNHANAAERGAIMDVDRKYPLDKLLEVARRYTRTLDRKITFEYVMIPDVNMGPENAARLVKIGRSVRCKINLIPLNTNLQGWRRPTAAEIEEFQSTLLDADLPVFNRGSPGKDIDAACGMLALAGATT